MVGIIRWRELSERSKVPKGYLKYNIAMNDRKITSKRANYHEKEECSVLGCGALWVYYKPMFRRNVSPPFSGQKK
jgi:hypothetical protein